MKVIKNPLGDYATPMSDLSRREDEMEANYRAGLIDGAAFAVVLCVVALLVVSVLLF